GAFSIWNLASMWRTTTAATAEYEVMDRADAVAVQIAWLRDTLRGVDGGTYSDLKFFAPIQTEVVAIVRELHIAARNDEGDGPLELTLGNEAADHLKNATDAASEAVNSN